MLGVIVAAAMLSMFYGQYRWLANEITTTSAAQHDAFLRANYERRVRAQMHSVADDIIAEQGKEDAASIVTLLNRAIAENETLAGLRYIGTDLGITRAGSLPDIEVSQPVIWLDENLVMTYPVTSEDEQLGVLIGSFESIRCTPNRSLSQKNSSPKKRKVGV